MLLSSRRHTHIALATIMLGSLLAWNGEAFSAEAPTQIFVLSSSRNGQLTEVVQANLNDGAVKFRYKAGISSDMTVSPDGSRLYISTNYWNEPRKVLETVLEIYDTHLGTLLNRLPNPDGLQFSLPVHPTNIAISESGRYVYFVKSNTHDGTTSWYVAAFDAGNNSFLTSRSPLDACPAPTLVPASKDLSLYAACLDSTYIRKIDFVNSSETSTPRAIPLPQQSRPGGLAAIAPNRSQQTLNVISRSGKLVQMELGDASPLDTHTIPGLDLGANTGLQLGLSAGDSSRVFFGVATRETSYETRFDSVVSLDPASSSAPLRSSPPQSFFSMAIGSNGLALYLVSPYASCVQEIDGHTLARLRTLKGLGDHPFFALAR